MGRAPTSGNCHTCRARRVKCDKTRPACNRCIKAGYECQGYETVLRIQSHAAVAGAAPGTSRLAKIQKVSSFPPEEAGAGGGKGEPRRYVRRPRARATPDADDARPAAPALPAELAWPAFVDDISFSYFFSSYGWINMHSILLQDEAMRGHLAEEGSMAYDCLRALSYGLLGRDRRIQSLRDTAQGLYGRAVRDLRLKLDSTSKKELAALVKPIAIMGSYSITVENDLRFTHHRGLARILEYCGPEYFQDPSLLPVFESCRLTLISNAVVSRQATFLERVEWKTVPYAKSATPRSDTSQLLDFLTHLPTLVSAVIAVLGDRINWLLSGCNAPRAEKPDTVPALQRRVSAIEAGLAAWRRDWEARNPRATPVLAWAYRRAADDGYRPRISGLHGPDIFDTNILDYGGGDDYAPEPDSEDPATLDTLQSVALYTTALVWTNRIARYLSGAARSPTSTSFLSAPFHTTCTCCELPAGPGLAPPPCDTIPPPGLDLCGADAAMTWNLSACRMAVAPVRITDSGYGSSVSSRSASSSPSRSPSPAPVPSSPPPLSELDGWSLMVPGDVRFAAQLRILRWLADRLPRTRAYVLATLAAIGLGHCAHDSRPADGIHEVADAVTKVLDDTRFEGAESILLRNYNRPVENPDAATVPG